MEQKKFSPKKQAIVNVGAGVGVIVALCVMFAFGIGGALLGAAFGVGGALLGVLIARLITLGMD